MPPFVRRKKGVTGEGAVDISVLLAKVLQKAHISENMDFRTLSERFEEVVGKAVYAHVKPDIIDKCNTLLGRPVIQAIRIV